MSTQLDPRVVRFQEIKRAAKEKAIREKEAVTNIMAAGSLTEKQARQVYQAQEAEKARIKRINIQGRRVIVQRLLTDFKNQFDT